MRGSDGKLCLSEMERGEVRKDYMERIMNEEKYLDYNVEGDAVEGPVVCVARKAVLQTLNEIKTGETPGSSEASLEMIAASGGVGIQVMVEISQSNRRIWNAS